MRVSHALLLAGSFMGCLPVCACVNDRDSDALALQAKELPDAVRVITGRFERNPPLYYQMRAERVRRELKTKPHQWGLYDDLGAALDRLHRSEDALRVMAQKRAVLPPYDAKKPQVKEAWYRYYANVGTFRAHNWLKGGATAERKREMERARDEIRRAIQIKPDAHFGREKYQLRAMEWILATRQPNAKPKPFGTYLDEKLKWSAADSEMGTETAVEPRENAVDGLSGLIVLGAAWESPDIFEALSESLLTDDAVTVRHLALLRSAELLKSNRKSLGGLKSTEVIARAYRSSKDGMGVSVNGTNQQALNELYPKLRVEADQWVSTRAKFMNDRLRQGRHPDTDPKFWVGYTSAPPPSLEMAWFDRDTNRYEGAPEPKDRTKIVGITGLIGAGLLSCLVVGWRRRSRRAL